MDIALFLFFSLWLIAVTMRIWLYAKTHLWVLTTTHELSLIKHIVTLCVEAGADPKTATLWLARYHIVLPESFLETAFTAELSGYTEDAGLRGEEPTIPYSKN